jgi:hypothetical protein
MIMGDTGVTWGKIIDGVLTGSMRDILEMIGSCVE